MARINQALYSLNGGAVSPLALTRIDLSQLTICGEIEENWLLSTLGWKGIRPGTQNNGTIRNNEKPQFLRFVGTASTCSLLELTPNTMRIWNDDALVRRTAVDTTIVNGEFDSLNGWLVEQPTAGLVYVSGGNLIIGGTGNAASSVTQAVGVSAAASGKEHGLRITVARGPVTLSIGTFNGGDDIVAATSLGTGEHSIAVRLTGTAWVRLSATDIAPRIVARILVEGEGIVELPTPWAAAAIGSVRFDQQGDVLFCAYRGARQQRIESRSRRSWSVVEYMPTNGPFRPMAANLPSLTPSATTGTIQITANRAAFNLNQVGSILEMTHRGQTASAILTGPEQYTAPIRVTGVGEARRFIFIISGTFDARVSLEYAIGSPEGWVTVAEYSAATNLTYRDTYDNAIAFYRLGIRGDQYASGQANVIIGFSGGSTTGTAVITEVRSPVEAVAYVTKELGGARATASWRDAAWSNAREWPRDVMFQDGRIWWLGKSLLYGSVSDDFTNYDDATEGDSAPVIRSLATGPADGNLWIIKLFRMIAASATSITGVRSSSLDEPITQTAFTAREIDQAGAADMKPAAVGGRGVYVGRSNVDLFEITPSSDIGDYAVSLLSRLNPEITSAGIVRVTVQRRPEPRIWCVLADGTIAILTYNREEKVVAWQTWKTDGFVEECQILPNVKQDDVFLCVNRLLNGSWTRRMERCSYETEAVGGPVNRIADCGRAFTSSSATATLTGLEDFNGKTVAVWTPSRRGYRVPVVAGSCTIPEAVTSAWVGLPYRALFKSTKLAYAADLGTALLQKKRVERLGVAFSQTSRMGVRLGHSLDRLDPLPLVVRGKEIDPNMVEDDIDEPAVPYNDTWDTDSRFFIEASAPWPCRAKAAVATITTHDAR